MGFYCLDVCTRVYFRVTRHIFLNCGTPQEAHIHFKVVLTGLKAAQEGEESLCAGKILILDFICAAKALCLKMRL